MSATKDNVERCMRELNYNSIARHTRQEIYNSMKCTVPHLFVFTFLQTEGE